MRASRTPDQRVADLAPWSFAPRDPQVTAHDGTRLRFHFVDEGPFSVLPAERG